MRVLPCVVLSLILPWAAAACATSPMPASDGPMQASVPALARDTPSTTVAGHTFIAPAGWKLSVRGPATLLEAPEGGSWLALIDIEATDAQAALLAGWAAYKASPIRPVTLVTPLATKNGWTDRQVFAFETSPTENREVSAQVRRADKIWQVVIRDLAADVVERRSAQINQVFGKLLPKGHERETFAGKPANKLDAARIAELGGFIERAMAATGVPGVALGLVQDGRVVYSGGFGVKELGQPGRPDGDTRFLVASNTKAMATLMLATLVDEHKLGWNATAVSLLPSFKLGSAEATSRLQVKHLICACTGMPRQDMEWSLGTRALTAGDVVTLLGTTRPTSGFGELFQYSNLMAAAAGYLGGHVAYPEMELGAAYDKAMQDRVFSPLGMNSTTHDFARARQGNFAVPHSPELSGRMTRAEERINLPLVPVRPAGGAWSTVNDMLRYVQMELDEGLLPDGRRMISREALLARRAPQVAVSTDIAYGMGLMIDTVYGTPLVHHGGDMPGYHSDMMWLPEHNVGAVVLTNGDPGWLLPSTFRRKLVEILFDGRDEAHAQVTVQAKAYYDGLAADRKRLTLPAAAEVAAGLAGTYGHPALGEIRVKRQDGHLSLDFAQYVSEVGSRHNPDGTESLVTVVPGGIGLEFLVGRTGGKRTLTLHDAQHEYVLVER